MTSNKRKFKRRSVDLNTSGVKTRGQKNKINSLNFSQQKTKKNTMAQLSVDTLLNCIPVFDGKKDSNIQFFIDEFDYLINQTDLGKVSKLALLKTKLGGAARDKLANEENLNTEKDYEKFKEKLIDAFSTKTSFSAAQSNFFSLRQKPAQAIADFISEFNAAAKLYLDKSGQNIDNGNDSLFEMIKFTRFLESVRSDLSLDIRRMAPKNFKEACKFAKQMEDAYNQVASKEINSITKTSTEENLEKLLKLNIESAEQIKILTSEMNNLKVMPKRDNASSRWCELCKKISHTLETCWYKNDNKNSDKGNRDFADRHFNNRYYYNGKYQPRANFNPRFVNPNQHMQFQYYAPTGGYYGYSPYPPPPPNYFPQHVPYRNSNPQSHASYYPNADKNENSKENSQKYQKKYHKKDKTNDKRDK